MQKLTYTMTALEPIHTGSDDLTAIAKKFRREKVIYPEPHRIQSRFKTEESRRRAIITVLSRVWKRIDKSGWSSARRLRSWDEYSSKILAATGVRTRFQFLTALCQAYEVRSLAADDGLVADILEKFDDMEFLQVIRDELIYLILLLRRLHEAAKEDQTSSLQEPQQKDLPPLTFQKAFEYVPVIDANSIGGAMRRLAMRDFVRLAGITKLSKQHYRELFTGGLITSGSRYEDIGARDRYIQMCPMIGLFGSAIGTGTIESELKIADARPICLEHGNGEMSYWELLEDSFNTRRADEKTETELEIIGDEKGNSESQDETEEDREHQRKQTVQMYFTHEVMSKGAQFTHMFLLTSEDPILVAAFWRALKLFKGFSYLGGRTNRGRGLVEVSYTVKDGAAQPYLAHIEQHKTEIQECFATDAQ